MINYPALVLILLQSGCMADQYAESFRKLEKKLDTIIETLDRADEKLETIAELVSNEGQILSSNYTSNLPDKALVLADGNQTELVIPSTSNCTSNLPVNALILSAGNQTELVIPSAMDGCATQTCTLPDVGSDHYYSHTVDGLFVCGGDSTAEHCMHFSEGSWVKSHNLPGGRWAHSSVVVGEKLVLIGGEDGNTTDILDTRTGKTKNGFALKHFSMWSCAMPVLRVGNPIIVTGGIKEDPCCDGSPVVSLYTIDFGWVMDLEPLNEGRLFHGCGSFIRDDGTQIFMVAGGKSKKTGGKFLKSTEALIEAAWKHMNPLPMSAPVSMATLGNRLYAVGLDIPGEGMRSSIVVWNDKDNFWKRIKQFSQQGSTAMSTVEMTEELLSYC